MPQFASVNGARLAYDIAGEGPDIVLIHAGVTSRGMWDGVMPLLSTTNRVLRYDMRGFGESMEDEELPWAAHSDLIGVMDAAGIEQAHVAGVSMGGGAALDTALMAPDRVASVIAVNPGLGGFEQDPDPWAVPLWKEMYALWDAGDKAAVARNDMQIWLAGPHRKLDDMRGDMIGRMQQWLLTAYEKEPFEREEKLDPATNERLSEIQQPVLAVLGGLDISTMEAVIDRIATAAPHSRKVVMPDTAHLSPWEQPEEFVRIVREFLA
jgi:pimeloyl-ACP methyl ester carboxylesterase